jgi:lipoprotein-anchoring transpeptidase ErfK/SrfK
VGVLAIGGVAFALLRSDSSPSASADLGDAKGVADHASTTTVPQTSSTTRPGLHQPAPATLPPIPGGTMGPGASGDVVKAYQQRLVDLHFDPGAIDGKYGGDMAYAVEAVQKIIGAPRTGKIGPTEATALATFQYPQPLQPNGEANRTEIDITKQVITLYQDYQVRLITTTSSGSGARYCYSTPRVNPTQRICEYANTPSGRFTYTRFVNGWDKSPLGQLYNPFYFNGGIAVHGYQEVPTYPASHGCTRIPMDIAQYWHTLVHVGDPVYVFGGTPEKIISSTPIAPPVTTAPTVPPPAAPVAPPPTVPATVPPTTAPTTTPTTPPPT